jgi:hypothetical protein
MVVPVSIIIIPIVLLMQEKQLLKQITSRKAMPQITKEDMTLSRYAIRNGAMVQNAAQQNGGMIGAMTRILSRITVLRNPQIHTSKSQAMLPSTTENTLSRRSVPAGKQEQ